jgi:hypothetical protein
MARVLCAGSLLLMLQLAAVIGLQMPELPDLGSPPTSASSFSFLQESMEVQLQSEMHMGSSTGHSARGWLGIEQFRLRTVQASKLGCFYPFPFPFAWILIESILIFIFFAQLVWMLCCARIQICFIAARHISVGFRFD